MRITHHGDDLLVTDQSLGLGAFLVALGVLFLVAAASRLVDGQVFAFGTLIYVVAGLGAVKFGMDRLVATQIIVDRDEALLIAKRWSISGTQQQRIPFDAVTGFTIEPEGQAAKTELFVQTTRGPVCLSGGSKAVREAWQDIQLAVETHMADAQPAASAD